jgi:hypothetical protein
MGARVFTHDVGNARAFLLTMAGIANHNPSATARCGLNEVFD